MALDVAPELTAGKQTLHGGFHKMISEGNTLSALRKKKLVPWSESNLGLWRYEADVYRTAPFQHS